MEKILSQLSDTQLIECFKENNDKAFDELFRRHWEHIFFYLYKLSSHNDREQMEDLAQEVFIRAMQSIRNGTYKDESQFISWLICIARNIFIDYARKKNRRNLLKISYTKELFGHPDNLLETYQEKRLMNKEIQKEVMACLNKLEDNQREPLILRFFGEYKYKDIVKILSDGKISINTFIGRTHYGLKNIREMLRQAKLL